MNILLLGPPGAGKGTLAQYLVQEHKMSLLSTGHMLRQAIADKTEMGLKAKTLMDQGQLVSDAVMLDLVTDFINRASGANGLVFDGFPRTLVQAKAMKDRNIKLDVVVFLDVADDVLIKRMSGRRVHPGSGRVYHLENNPPKTPGLDDITQEPLIIRSDDQESVLRERLEVYKDLTEPLVNFYKSIEVHFKTIDAVAPIDEVLSSFSSYLEKLA